jgi:ABC-type sugar transport system substrate-binding protein
MEKPIENPLAKLVAAALRQAAKKVVKRAKESGTPVIIWQDEQIKKVDPRKINKSGR